MEEHYTKVEVPNDYVCHKCEATGCKMWRHFDEFSEELLCAKCAAESQNQDIRHINNRGRRVNSVSQFTNQIGALKPAIPCEEKDSKYWGNFFSVKGIMWWEELPTYPS